MGQPQPTGTCGLILNDTDVWGGDVAPKQFTGSLAKCCELCEHTKHCDVATYWGSGDCGLKSWATKTNLTSNTERTSQRVSKDPLSDDELCAQNAGVLAVRNATQLDLLVYNHAAFVDPIVNCSVVVNFEGTLVAESRLRSATVRRIDEEHANPVGRWIEMGAPDYTTAAQNELLRQASELRVEKLVDVAELLTGGLSFTIMVPAHGVA